MQRMISRLHLVLAGVAVSTTVLVAADSKLPAGNELAEYRTAETALVSRVSLAPPGRAGLAGYLGVRVAPDERGKLIVAEVSPDSPAAKAGLQKGDVLNRMDGQAIAKAESLREALMSRAPGESLKLQVLRAGQSMDLTATLGAVSRPMRVSGQRVLFGVQLGDPKEMEGVPVTRVQTGSPAASAGLADGDVILKINDSPLTRVAALADILSDKKPGDTVAVLVNRGGKEMELKVQLAEDRAGGPGGGFGGGRFGGRGDSTPPPLWKKDVYRLAVIGVEYADIKHNAKITASEWEQALFSRNAYSNRASATGQPVHGSLNDYFQEQSYGRFRVEGKVFDWVQVSKKRGDYSQGSGTSNRTAPLVEALDKLYARDGKDALKDFDGLFFIYAGDLIRGNRGAVYSPHSGGLFHQNKRWSYMLNAEGGNTMTSLAGYCREFAFLLGLPDLAARTENAGSEGCGVWCMLSSPLSPRPQHLCAWSKEQLGWLQAAVLDPTVKQKLILAPVENSAKECYKVLLRSDGSEYFLLENRRKKGFDSGLPAEGLLIWRVLNNRPVLEESHGVEGASGPRVFPDQVPFPTAVNNSFTPATSPSSRSQRGGGLPVHLTEIRKLPDGRIAFQIGYEFH
jgi:M6 family metalloprotease-like protein